MDIATYKVHLHGSSSSFHSLFSFNIEVIALTYIFFFAGASFESLLGPNILPASDSPVLPLYALVSCSWPGSIQRPQ